MKVISTVHGLELHAVPNGGDGFCLKIGMYCITNEHRQEIFTVTIDFSSSFIATTIFFL